jgi:hypothetical protein
MLLLSALFHSIFWPNWPSSGVQVCLRSVLCFPIDVLDASRWMDKNQNGIQVYNVTVCNTVIVGWPWVECCSTKFIRLCLQWMGIYVINQSCDIVFKHPVALVYHLFHTRYFHQQCNLLLSTSLLTTCFGCTQPSSGVSNSLKLLHYMECPASHITCECDIFWLKIHGLQLKSIKTS